MANAKKAPKRSRKTFSRAQLKSEPSEIVKAVSLSNRVIITDANGRPLFTIARQKSDLPPLR